MLVVCVKIFISQGMNYDPTQMKNKGFKNVSIYDMSTYHLTSIGPCYFLNEGQSSFDP